jgi:hypothetical protein
MSENPQDLPVVLGPDEKMVQVMLYTQQYLCWGTVVVKEIVRVSTWLRTGAAPDNVRVLNAKLLLITGSTSQKPTFCSEIHINISQIMIFHIRPPASDPIDFDPSELNRRMVPVSIFLGNFEINGSIRLAISTDLAKFIDVNRETFTAIYDAVVFCPVHSTMAITKVPFLIVRQSHSIFAGRENSLQGKQE